MPPMIGPGAVKGALGKLGAVTSSAGFGQHAIGAGMSVALGAMSGDGLVSGIVNGAMYYAADAVVPGAFWISTLGRAVGSATQGYIEESRYGNARIQKNYKGNFGGEFRDSQGSYTMRQRGVAAMQQSKLNARGVLGSEARSFHTSY